MDTKMKSTQHSNMYRNGASTRTLNNDVGTLSIKSKNQMKSPKRSTYKSVAPKAPRANMSKKSSTKMARGTAGMRMKNSAVPTFTVTFQSNPAQQGKQGMVALSKKATNSSTGTNPLSKFQKSIRKTMGYK